MIRLDLMSVADTAVVTMQDLMELGTEARMNFPGKTGGYWRWRYTPQMLTAEIGRRLRELTVLYGRAPQEEEEEEQATENGQQATENAS
jgi:4-alpha-glucanotransferase